METVEAISLMLGAAWASGINLYAAVLVLGWLGMTGQADLPPQLEILSDPMVMFAAGAMYVVEFFADKTPGVDSAWDTLHTFIRIPAGAIMAASVAEGMDVGQAAEFAALLVGGSLAATSHAAKAGTRALINTSPEPFSNWTASIAEDLAVIGGLWAALNYPVLFLVALVLFIALVIWLLPKIWRALKSIARAIGRWFSPSPTGRPQAESGEPPPSKRRELLQQLYDDAHKDGR
jgi:hypothetical protein